MSKPRADICIYISSSLQRFESTVSKIIGKRRGGREENGSDFVLLECREQEAEEAEIKNSFYMIMVTANSLYNGKVTVVTAVEKFQF